MTKIRRIKASIAFSRVADAPLVSRLTAIHDGLKDNPAYTRLPVELPVFKATIDSLSTAIGEALDGGKKAISEKNRLRHLAIDYAETLGQHVQANCNNDLATFMSSGFTPQVRTRSAAHEPLAPPAIGKVEHGNTSGQLLVSIPAVRNARAYELRYAALGPGGISGEWTTVPVTFIRAKKLIDGLTPGTMYAFQVRALGHSGYTDWSNSVNRMAV